MPLPFAHLHCHSHYSLLDGASRLESLLEKCKSSGMNALALTDHGNLYGALEFYRKAKEAGINPILGMEAYVAPSNRFRREGSEGGEESSYHLTLLARDRVGFKNLIKLSSRAFLEGFYRKPRIDRELLQEHHEGIICLSGCVSGEFSQAILRGTDPELRLKEAMEIARWFRKLFGERYFIEIMNNGLEIQRVALEGAVEVATKLGIPLVATSDAHYVNQEDWETQDILLCVNTGRFRTDANRMRMEGNQFHLRTPEEMYAAFPGLEDAVRRSQEIADSVRIELELGRRHFPTYPLPAGQNSDDFLRKLCIEGLKQRYANDPSRLSGGELSQEVLNRLDRELSVISKLGFANYFLIVWDFVRFARERGIPSTARGSGVGSLVAYALHLSHVCPLTYGLLFERFLDENRREAPDIDIDFCKERRGEVIEYVKQKYGAANVAQIGTFGTLAARAAIRDVGRALSMSIPQVDAVVAMVPVELGIELDEALQKSDDLREAYESDPQTRELIDFARKIEGLARNVGTHAAAVVIADQPLMEYVPLQHGLGKEEVITQWAMGDVEAAGLLKMDFLGLKNLTILSKAVDLIKQTTGKRVDPHEFPLDDKATFELLCRGETKGIFQLESGGIRDLLQRMKPDHFRDIIATNALYRPGPLEGGMVDDYIDVKHGRKPAIYPHPVMKEVLEETHGVMVYQEQVMRVLNLLGGIELADAYTCIKAISKKKLPVIAKYREEFVQGATAKGLKKSEAEELFGMIEKFAGYGFNKCVVGETTLVDAMTGDCTTVGELFHTRRAFQVHSLGKDGKLRPRAVTDVVWNGRKCVYRLKTTGGKTLVATGNHPLFTPDGWKELSKLKPGDEIGVAREAEQRGRPWSGTDSQDYWTHDASTATCTTADVGIALELAWEHVQSIDSAGVADTYDLTVDQDHNFVADGLVVHNSHSTAYAKIAYMTAYLKAHYPLEFMAALLSGDIHGRNFKTKDSLVEHLEDCRRMGIEVAPPDVNASHADFVVQDGKIRFGLMAIKGCGGQAAAALVQNRQEQGPFVDLFDFCARLDPSVCGRTTTESLIKAGAFDSTGARRSQCMAVLDKAITQGVAAAKDRKSGQKKLFSMFGEEPPPVSGKPRLVGMPDLPEWQERERLAAEKEVLGFYLTSHPLAEYQTLLSTYCTYTTVTAAHLPHRSEVLLGGMLSAIKFAHTKNPRPGQVHTRYAMFDLEDMEGIMRCIIWPEQFAQYGHLVKPDAVLAIRGAIDKRQGSDEANLIVNELMLLEELKGRFTRGLVIRLNERQHGSKGLENLFEILRGYPGDCEVHLHLGLVDGTNVKMQCDKLRVALDAELERRVEELLGRGSLQHIAAPTRAKAPERGGNGKSYARGARGH